MVVAGCVPQAQPRMDYLKGLSIIGVCYFTHTYTTHRCKKKCVVHIDSLTRHPPGCQSAVILFYFGLPAAEWIDRPPRETQPALHDGNDKAYTSKKADKYLLGVGVKRGQKCRIWEQQGPGKKINGQENRIVP